MTRILSALVLLLAATLMSLADSPPADAASVVPTLEFNAPESISPDDQITFTGRLSYQGTPLPDRPVEVISSCSPPPIQSGKLVGTAITQDDGTFRLTDDPGDCATYYYRAAAYRIDPQYDRVEAIRSVDLNWSVPAVDLQVVPTGAVGSPVNVTITLTDQNGPVVGKPVELADNNSEIATLNTDEAGQITTVYDSAHAGTRSISAWFKGDSVSREAVARVVIQIDRQPSALEMSGPATIGEGDPMTVTGRVTTTSPQPTGGLTVRVERVDRNGWTSVVGDAITASDGRFSLTDPEPMSGTTIYTGTLEAENLEPSTAAWTVDGVLETPALAITSDRTTYGVGDTAHLHIELTASAPREVWLSRITARRSSAVWHGVVDGYAEVELPVNATADFRAFTQSSEWWQSATASTSVSLQPSLHTTVAGGRVRNGIHHFPTSADPLFESRLRPGHAGQCIRYVLQRFSDGAWAEVGRSRCRSTDTTGRSAWTLTGKQAAGIRYRVRAEFAGDTLDIATAGNWVAFKFAAPQPSG